MFYLHLLFTGALTLMGVINALFETSLSLFDKASFDLIFEIPVVAYFVIQDSAVTVTQPLDLTVHSSTDLCEWGIPGLLSLRPVTLPPSVVGGSAELQVYSPEGLGLVNLMPPATTTFASLGDHPEANTFWLPAPANIDLTATEQRQAQPTRTFTILSGIFLAFATLVFYTLLVVYLAQKAVLGEVQIEFPEGFPVPLPTQPNFHQEVPTLDIESQVVEELTVMELATVNNTIEVDNLDNTNLDGSTSEPLMELPLETPTELLSEPAVEAAVDPSVESFVEPIAKDQAAIEDHAELAIELPIESVTPPTEFSVEDCTEPHLESSVETNTESVTLSPVALSADFHVELPIESVSPDSPSSLAVLSCSASSSELLVADAPAVQMTVTLDEPPTSTTVYGTLDSSSSDSARVVCTTDEQSANATTESGTEEVPTSTIAHGTLDSSRSDVAPIVCTTDEQSASTSTGNGTEAQSKKSKKKGKPTRRSGTWKKVATAKVKAAVKVVLFEAAAVAAARAATVDSDEVPEVPQELPLEPQLQSAQARRRLSRGTINTSILGHLQPGPSSRPRRTGRS
ncbi:unnamed protein product [Somion occarium]|uniref:Uncharacterized protein n=1 Tax=Somion occarium TaxID=3059160 RepID=A0ABP1EAR6_9APHY